MEEAGTNRGTEYIDHRGGLVYQQEHGYKLITLTVWLRTPDEQSFVIIREGDFEFREEADHIQSGLPLVLPYPQLVAIDVYHFSVADEAEIELTIKGQSGERQARYTINATGIEEDSPSFRLNIVRSSESVRDHHVQSCQDYDIHVQLENPPTYPQTIKNISLNEIDHLVKVDANPHFIGGYNVFSGYSKDSLGFTAQGLINLAEWVTEHQYQLQIEAKTNCLQMQPDNHEIDFDR